MVIFLTLKFWPKIYYAYPHNCLTNYLRACIR